MKNTPYTTGMVDAALELGLEKVAARRLRDPAQDSLYYGDQDIDRGVRQEDLLRELRKIDDTDLPPLGSYTSGPTLTGGLTGALTGAGAGASLLRTNPVMGAAIGGALGGGLGGGTGYLLGKSDFDEDVSLQNTSSRLLDDVHQQKSQLAQYKQLRDQQLANEQREHERQLARMRQMQHNINYDVKMN